MMACKIKFVRSLMKAAALATVPKHVDHFSKFSPSPLSMKQFLDFGECAVSTLTVFRVTADRLGSPRTRCRLMLWKKNMRLLSDVCEPYIVVSTLCLFLIDWWIGACTLCRPTYFYCYFVDYWFYFKFRCIVYYIFHTNNTTEEGLLRIASIQPLKLDYFLLKSLYSLYA